MNVEWHSYYILKNTLVNSLEIKTNPLFVFASKRTRSLIDMTNFSESLIDLNLNIR